MPVNLGYVLFYAVVVWLVVSEARVAYMSWVRPDVLLSRIKARRARLNVEQSRLGDDGTVHVYRVRSLIALVCVVVLVLWGPSLMVGAE